MSAHGDDRLQELVARIAAPQPREAPVGDDVTGELHRLAMWWGALSEGDADQWRAVVPGPAGPGPTEAGAAPAALDELLAGAAAADRAVDAGATLLVPRTRRRDDVAARAVIGLLTRREASAVVDQPDGMPDRAWMARCAAVRDLMAMAAEHRGEPVALLDAVGAGAIAATAGALLGAAARRTPCLVDGTDELAAALVADRLCYRAKGWWRAGADSPDPGRTAAVERIDLTRGLPLALTDDEGRGAQATLALLAALERRLMP